jgi:hypothetical protein
MTVQTFREKILAMLHGDVVESLPFFHWWRHSQIGWAERECRNRGMGICWLRPPHTTILHNVKRTIVHDPSKGSGLYRVIYSTPLGSVYQDEKREPGVGQWHGLRSWRDVTPWHITRLVKSVEDYDVAKYIVDHTEYQPYYFPIEQAKEWLGEDGLVVASLPHSPMQMLMIDWVGSEGGRFYIHHARYREKVDALYESLVTSYSSMYEIAAHSPADVVMFGDNIDGVLVNPRLFKQYYMPTYDECADILHAQGKYMAVHMDGRLSILKDLIAQTSIDIIEAVHPPPMGDLAIHNALSRWMNKVIWMGYPGSVYTLGPHAVKEHSLQLLRSIIPGDRLCIEMSTENLVSNENLLMLTSILENAELPLTQRQIDRIKKSLA